MYLNNQIIVLANSNINCHRTAQNDANSYEKSKMVLDCQNLFNKCPMPCDQRQRALWVKKPPEVNN